MAPPPWPPSRHDGGPRKIPGETPSELGRGVNLAGAARHGRPHRARVPRAPLWRAARARPGGDRRDRRGDRLRASRAREPRRAGAGRRRPPGGGLRSASPPLERAEAAHSRAVCALLQPPARCEGEGGILVSSSVIVGRGTPAKRGGRRAGAQVDVELTSGPVRRSRALTARRSGAGLYGAPEDLGARRPRRGGLPISLRSTSSGSAELPDPAQPPIARSGVAASGGAVEVLVARARSRSIWALLDRARARVPGAHRSDLPPRGGGAGARAGAGRDRPRSPWTTKAFRTSGLRAPAGGVGDAPGDRGRRVRGRAAARSWCSVERVAVARSIPAGSPPPAPSRPRGSTPTSPGAAGRRCGPRPC